MHGFDREELQAPLAEINMTPLVDVMLVLLVIFLVTAPMLNNAIKLKLPNEVASSVNDPKAITISLNSQGQYYLDDKSVSLKDLEIALQNTAAKNSKQQIQIRADIDVSYGKISHVLAIAKRSGLVNIGFVTEPQ